MANRALLIGIKRYPDPRNTLQGCIKDALAVKQLLQDYYGFSDEDIRELHDDQATLANLRLYSVPLGWTLGKVKGRKCNTIQKGVHYAATVFTDRLQNTRCKLVWQRLELLGKMATLSVLCEPSK